MAPQSVTLPVPDGPTVRRGLLILATILLVAYLAYVVREIWVPLGLAFVLATVLDPVVDRMEARGWRRTPAAAFIFGSTILIVVGLVALALPHLVSQGQEMQARFVQYFPDTSHEGLVKSFAKMNLPNSVAAVGVQAFETGRAGIQQSSTYLSRYGLGVLSNLIWLVIIPIVAFYALVDFHLILGKLLLLVPRRLRGATQTYVSEVSGVFARYLRGLALLSLLNGVATAALLMAFQVPSALVIGVIAGVLYAVPYVGALLTIVITAAASFVGGGVNTMIYVVGLSVLLHQLLFDQVIAPRIQGHSVGLHPILSIVALLSGNLLLGIVGMILAVPIAACIQILVLALVPKLQMEIELPDNVPAPTEGGALAQESRDIHNAVEDSSATLHQSLQRAVAEVDLKFSEVPPHE